MPIVETSNFGPISFEDGSALFFPRGLPGFDQRRAFALLHFPQSDPLIYLQSLEDPALCFITMPVLAVAPRYRLQVPPADLDLIGLRGAAPAIGPEVLCLAVLSMREEGPTANLLAPVVVNLRNGKSVQAVAEESDYSHQHALFAEEAVACS
jgi:flagellar assembly factor FliW